MSKSNVVEFSRLAVKFKFYKAQMAQRPTRVRIANKFVFGLICRLF